MHDYAFCILYCAFMVAKDSRFAKIQSKFFLTENCTLHVYNL